MRTTSHFIGASLDSGVFTDLFVELQEYFKSHDLEWVVEFQNILSLHVTLYYLENSINATEMTRILGDLADASTVHAFSMTELRVGYFGEPTKERVCYLGCARNEVFEQLNQFFAHKYNRAQIPENQLAFVPHITLFKILEPEAYGPRKQEIDAIISKAIQARGFEHIITGLHLFRVNSAFRPEIQIII